METKILYIYVVDKSFYCFFLSSPLEEVNAKVKVLVIFFCLSGAVKMSVLSDLAGFINSELQNAGINVSPVVGEIIVSIFVFILSIIVGWVVYFIFENFLTEWAKKTKTTLDDEILRNTKKPVYFFVILVGAYYAFSSFPPLKPYSTDITHFFGIVEILLIAFILTRVVNVFIRWYAEKTAEHGKRRMSEHLIFLLKKVIHAIIYIFAFLLILDTLGYDLSGVVVGLGVGGIAVALALQNILGDVFSAFSIYFDRPFEIGDFIVIDNYAGTVKRIGIKSTRVQLLQGEELVLSNRELTSAKVRNFKKMKKRRIVFTIGVTYDTPVKKLKKIPDIIKDIISKNEMTEIDRVHFKEFGEFSLNFEIVYYVKTRDYVKYMDIQQEINLAIKEAFEKEGIEIAFPTQTIFLNKTTVA